MLALVLRILGCLDLVALLAVVAPTAWLAAAHRGAGLGDWPDAPIAGYLARSASAMYALHGAIVLFISFDIPRYERLIRFMAFAALVHGTGMLVVDQIQGMPSFWRWGEGPIFALTGVLVLGLQRRNKNQSDR